MISFLAFLIGTLAPGSLEMPPSVGVTASIFSTIEQSEWCPAGTVRLNLQNGRYELTPRANRRVCTEADLERPTSRGQLGRTNLAILRAAYSRARAEGLLDESCRNGGQSDTIVVSNGGQRILVLTSGMGSEAAPDNLACWSKPAKVLHDLLDKTFRASP